MPTSPYIYEDGTTDAERYLTGCLDGNYVVGTKIKQLAERMLKEIDEGYEGYHYDPNYAIRPVAWIEKFCCLTTGKPGTPFILEPYERNILELTFGFVDDNNIRRIREVLLEIGRKNGKSVTTSTQLPTPSGWRTMAEIHPGDYVFGQDGKPSMVIAESEVFTDKPLYLVRFEDGAEVKATADHIWTVRHPYEDWFDTTTEELLPIISEGYEEVEVPRPLPVEYPEREFSEDPYSVGSICGALEVEVPDEYLLGSVAQRQALMDGLMGSCSCKKYGGERYVSFVTQNKLLMRQATELASSLGMSATLDDGCPDTLELIMPNGFDDGKLIKSIEPIPTEPTKCIAIDNPSHLYLVGRHYTATHNTELCAALNLYMLTSDGELAPQCYNAATNSSQAALCYGATMDMIAQSRALSRYLEQGNIPRRKTTGIKFKKEFSKQNLGYLVTLTRNSSALDGLNVHYAVLDELAALRDAAVYSLTTGSTGSQEQPLIFMPSTENYVRDGVWDQRKKYAARWLEGAIHDPHFLGICYEMDDRSEMFVEEAWPKANPGLGTVKKWSFMRSEALKAKNDPTNLPEFLTKQLNLPSNQAAAFLTFEAACNDETYEFDPKVFKYCYIGIDAADSVDLSAATALFMRPGDDRIYRRSMYWVPEVAVEQLTNNTRQRDGVPYKDWEARGLVRLTPGNKVPRTVFLDFIQELADEGLYCKGIAYDPWHMEVIEDRMKMMVGEANLLPLRQGAKTLSQPMKQIKADLVAHRIVDNANPIDHWCNMNIAAVTDRNGEVLPVKKAGPTSRIDGFMSLLFAYAMLMQRFDEYQVAIN